MATAKKTTQDEEVRININVSKGRVRYYILGDAPMIYNAMSNKALHELLLPAGKKNAAERAGTLKHEPVREYRESVYTSRDPNSPTKLVIKGTMLKKAIMGAARDVPGTFSTTIGRLLYVVGDEIPVYGSPELMMAVVRSADMKKTPDVRTRAILPAWAIEVDVEFTQPLIKEPSVTSLVSVAGMTQGIGDWRVEKGGGNYGRFSVVAPDDPRFQMLKEHGGRAAQEAALKNPVAFDSETEELLKFYDAEVKRRGFKVAA